MDRRLESKWLFNFSDHFAVLSAHENCAFEGTGREGKAKG
jgi:hypothetical protein